MSRGIWGDFGSRQHCSAGYTAARTKSYVKNDADGTDDVATSCLEMYCEGSNWQDAGNCVSWSGGTWITKYCPTGTKVYGMQTKFESRQEDGDDTATNNVNLYCR